MLQTKCKSEVTISLSTPEDPYTMCLSHKNRRYGPVRLAIQPAEASASVELWIWGQNRIQHLRKPLYNAISCHETLNKIGAAADPSSEACASVEPQIWGQIRNQRPLTPPRSRRKTKKSCSQSPKVDDISPKTKHNLATEGSTRYIQSEISPTSNLGLKWNLACR